MRSLSGLGPLVKMTCGVIAVLGAALVLAACVPMSSASATFAVYAREEWTADVSFVVSESVSLVRGQEIADGLNAATAAHQAAGINSSWSLIRNSGGDSTYTLTASGRGLDSLNDAFFRGQALLYIDAESGFVVFQADPGWVGVDSARQSLTLRASQIASSNGTMVDQQTVTWTNPTRRLEAILIPGTRGGITPYTLIVVGFLAVAIAAIGLVWRVISPPSPSVSVPQVAGPGVAPRLANDHPTVDSMQPKDELAVGSPPVVLKANVIIPFGNTPQSDPPQPSLTMSAGLGPLTASVTVPQASSKDAPDSTEPVAPAPPATPPSPSRDASATPAATAPVGAAVALETQGQGVSVHGGPSAPAEAVAPEGEAGEPQEARGTASPPSPDGPSASPPPEGRSLQPPTRAEDDTQPIAAVTAAPAPSSAAESAGASLATVAVPEAIPSPPVLQSIVPTESARPDVNVSDSAASGAVAASNQAPQSPRVAEPASLAPAPTDPTVDEDDEDMVVLRLCDYCGSNCPPDAVFCPICGTALPAA